MWNSAQGTAAACLLIVVLLLPSGATVAAETPMPGKNDVRVLIDISGSMRQNDPENLRRPALRMLAGLLQPGTRAGVWTFARWSNNLVPVAEVDPAWKKRVLALSKQISSPGQFTNIEEVLDKASVDWGGDPSSHARHLILLTDGMVDISKQADESTQSRARILDQLLPRLQADRVKVHTIALSQRADHDLMQRLAAETGGWYQQVEQADELQRVFLRMFEKVGSPDTVPLEDNRFVVDGSVNEATVLLFSKPGSEPAVLQSPSGETYTDSDLPAGIAWFRDQGYDMITIASPQKGEWALQADVDPDNRVMIVTDLKLQTSEVPSHIAAGEQARIEANLSNRGKLVTRQAFLRLIEVRADASVDGIPRQLDLNDRGEEGDEKAADGRYAARLSEPAARPEMELLVAVDSPTFMREKRFRLAVHEPLEAALAETPEGPVLSAAIQAAVMQPGASLSAWQEDLAGQRLPLQLTEVEAGRWSAPLQDLVSATYVRVTGVSRLGNPIDSTTGPLMMPGVQAPQPVVEEPAVTEPAIAAEPPPLIEPVESAVAPQHEQGDWLIPAIIFGGVNLVLLTLAGLWFFVFRKRAGNADELALEQLIEAQEAAPGDGDDARLEEAA
jgi:hypothetical protein